MTDKDALAEYLSFEKRAVAAHLAVFGCTKGVVKREMEVMVVCSVIPPLIVEVCRRSHERIVLAVTCNLLTFNDHDSIDLPPLFEYAEGERASFRRMAFAKDAAAAAACLPRRRSGRREGGDERRKQLGARGRERGGGKERGAVSQLLPALADAQA
eukprot:1087498-Pleurochrysis_carterae.AAC.1